MIFHKNKPLILYGARQVGGMPAAVNAFTQTNDLAKVCETQNEILRNYKNDFSKHISPHDIPKVRMLWDSMPAHFH